MKVVNEKYKWKEVRKERKVTDKEKCREK